MALRCVLPTGKFSLVNGMHTMLAFMTLRELFTDDDGGREYILLKYSKVPRDQQRMMEAWRTARVAQLIEKFGLDSLMTWHTCESREAVWDVMLEHADHVLEASLPHASRAHAPCPSVPQRSRTLPITARCTIQCTLSDADRVPHHSPLHIQCTLTDTVACVCVCVCVCCRSVSR
jgi:hypothetical protein